MKASVAREQGAALVATVVLGMAVATTATLLIAVTESERLASERARDRIVALAAAEAGVAEASTRIVADPDYAAGAAEGRDVGDPALLRWVPLEGTAAYRYDLAVTEDVVTVTARGRAGTVERRLEVALRPRGFADLHRFTDVEVTDPHVVPGTTVAGCDRTSWSDPPRVAGCPEAVYGPTEVLGGDVHTNDVLLVRGQPAFTGSVSTAWIGGSSDPTGGALWRAADASAAPSFRHPPRHHGVIALPAGLAAIPIPEVGVCHYHGPTLVRLDGDRMRVWSPGSSDPLPGAPPTSVACGAGLLGGRVTVGLPAAGIVRVHPARSGCAVHPLGLASSEEHNGGYGCANGDVLIWGTYDGALTVLAEHDAHVVWDVRPADAGRGSDDALGIVAGRSIVVRRPVSPPIRGSAPYGRNLAVAGPGIAPFGSHPLDSPTAAASAWTAPHIDAHLLALGRSVRIQNPARGQRNAGTLFVRGSIAQRFRGPFELPIPGTTIVTGYASVTEPRVGVLRAAPPAFPRLDDGTWVTVGWREITEVQ